MNVMILAIHIFSRFKLYFLLFCPLKAAIKWSAEAVFTVCRYLNFCAYKYCNKAEADPEDP